MSAARRLLWLRALLLVALVTLGRPLRAHPLRTTAVLLDLGERAVGVEMQLPLDQLGLALELPLADRASSLVAEQGPALRSYVASHLGATAPDGRPFAVDVGALEVRPIDGADALVVQASMRPPDGATTRVFTLHDSVILHRVVTHKMFVSVRRDLRNAVFSDRPEVLGVLRYQRETLAVDRSQGSWWRGFAAVFWLGTRHIAEGSDHLLFLLVLLLPAPLLARAGRWGEPTAVRRSLRTILSVVTAFTVGHSLTLALAATGVLRLPSRPIEVLVAVSILVSAAHAWRPLVPSREWLLAGVFGLIHGLAFASALADMGFDGPGLAVSVLGFNLGIEAMQLLVVAVTLPWLLLLSRTRVYGPVRLGGVSVAALAALAWIAERAWRVQTPVTGLVDAAFARGPQVIAALASLTLGLTLAQRARGATGRTAASLPS